MSKDKGDDWGDDAGKMRDLRDELQIEIVACAKLIRSTNDARTLLDLSQRISTLQSVIARIDRIGQL